MYILSLAIFSFSWAGDIRCSGLHYIENLRITSVVGARGRAKWCYGGFWFDFVSCQSSSKIGTHSFLACLYSAIKLQLSKSTDYP